MPRYRNPTPWFAQPVVLVVLLAAAFGGGALVGRQYLLQRQVVPLGAGTLQVYFSPHGGSTAAIVRTIDAARQRVLVLAYAFTSRPIIRALVAAKRRGLQVVVVLDKSHIEHHKKYFGRTERYKPDPAITAFRAAGIPMYIDEKHAIAHNKVMLIDRSTIITGSFNFTYAAAHYNAENMLIIRGVPKIFAAYLSRFEHLESISHKYHAGMRLHHRYSDHHYHHYKRKYHPRG